MTRRFSASDLILAVGATLRLTRFITQDWLGEWAIDAPARKWANKHDLGHPFPDAVDHEQGWRSKLVKGLDCPFCVGFWLGVLVLGAFVLTPRPLRGLLRFGTGALSLNYLVGHVSHRLDS
jgi:hypothetical protein